MRSSLVGRFVGGIVLALCPVPSSASVNLDLRPQAVQVQLGNTIDVGIYAVLSGGVDGTFSGMDVVLNWDETHLELQEAISEGPHAWSFVFGLLNDSALDGLNDSLLDGNALFQAASFSAATATQEGMLVATLRFVAVGGTAETMVAMVPVFGTSSKTQVLAPGGQNVTGDLSGASIAVGGAVPTVSAWGLIILAHLVVTAGVMIIGRQREHRSLPRWDEV